MWRVEHVQAALENALDGVIGINSFGQIAYWSQQATAIFGWSGGYCAVEGCLDASDCPSGSRCVDVGGALGTCVEDCLASDDLCALSTQQLASLPSSQNK